MSDQQLMFKSDYTRGSQTTSPRPDALLSSSGFETETLTTASAAEPKVVVSATAADVLLDIERYGTGKPRRIVIRGKIAR